MDELLSKVKANLISLASGRETEHNFSHLSRIAVTEK